MVWAHRRALAETVAAGPGPRSVRRWLEYRSHHPPWLGYPREGGSACRAAGAAYSLLPLRGEPCVSRLELCAHSSSQRQLDCLRTVRPRCPSCSPARCFSLCSARDLRELRGFCSRRRPSGTTAGTPNAQAENSPRARGASGRASSSAQTSLRPWAQRRAPSTHTGRTGAGTYRTSSARCGRLPRKGRLLGPARCLVVPQLSGARAGSGLARVLTRTRVLSLCVSVVSLRDCSLVVQMAITATVCMWLMCAPPATTSRACRAGHGFRAPQR